METANHWLSLSVKNTKLIIVALLFTPLLFCGCGGGGSSSPSPSISTSSVSSSTRAHSSAAEDSSSSSLNTTATATASVAISNTQTSTITSAEDDTYCEEFSVYASNVEGNMYTYDAPYNSCFGIKGDGSQKKAVSVVSNQAEDNPLKVGSTLKIYNNNKPGHERTLLTIEITNTSTKAMCFVYSNFGYARLFNQNQEIIGYLSTEDYVNGWLYSLSLYSNQDSSTQSCISPGNSSTLVQSIESTNISKEDFEDIAYIELSEFEGLAIDEPLLPNLSSMEMQVKNPEISATFVNNSERTIYIDLGISEITFFDKDGYAVLKSFLFVDSIGGSYVYSGDLFNMSFAQSLSNEIWPANATKAIVYLTWEYAY